MNILQEYQAGQLIRETLVGDAFTVQLSTSNDRAFALVPPSGYQLNGHRVDCRCEICRPDIWRLP